MCKMIADLAGADRQLVKELIHRLEFASGAPGLDIRLTGEIYGALHMKMRALGLDPNDTTPHELYNSLMSLTKLHDDFLIRRLGIQEPYSADHVLPKVVQVLSTPRLSKTVWAMKPVVAKRLLKAVPPKNLMKELNYRSLDSLIKREPAIVLLTVARHLEPATWQQKMLDAYKKLGTNDFENRPITLEYLSDQRWQPLGRAIAQARRTNVMHAPETGAVLVLPMPNTERPGLALMSFLLVLHWMNEIRFSSTYYKFHHMQPNFGKLLSKSLTDQTEHHVELAGQSVHWRILHHYYGRADRLQHPEVFEPHIQSEDIAYRKAEAVLYQLEPALHFWHDLDYVGLPLADGKPLSFNLLDNAVNLVNGLNFDNRVTYHLRDSVWNELYSRYMGERALEQDILRQLDYRAIGNHVAVQDMEFVW